MKIFLIGGFLGSGKTTAITHACKELRATGRRVAIITNDQGTQQVDASYLKTFDLPVAEVKGGCFCCNYDQLDKHIRQFISELQPDIVFAESVGSCTDLVATVVKPLEDAIPDAAIIVSILTDAALLLALIEGKASFISDNVRYVYKKQLEEADILVINKTDLVSEEQLAFIHSVLQMENPGKAILHQNSADHADIRKWIETLYGKPVPEKRRSLDIDYDCYSDGEARLAWLDQKLSISSAEHNIARIVNDLIRGITEELARLHMFIGHLKFFIDAGDWQEKLSITMSDQDLKNRLMDHRGNRAHLLINARVQTDPAILEKIISHQLTLLTQAHECRIETGEVNAFRPGYPRPLHRIL